MATNDAPYSYFKDEFVPFYDQMAQECFGGTNAGDVKQYADMLLQLVRSSRGRDIVVVDLGCGSGRAMLSMLERLASLREGLPRKLHMYGVDNSKPVLAAAEAKCATLLQQHPDLGSSVTVSWTLNSFQAWCLPAQHKGQADFILVAAAGLHHVTNTAELQQSLQLMADHLSPEGICVISYLPWDELYRQNSSSNTAEALSTGCSSSMSVPAEAPAHTACTILTAEKFRVKGFKRVLVSRHVETQQDGSTVLHERFILSRLKGDDEAHVAWSIEEAWDLRQLNQQELLQLAAKAGLVPAKGCWDGDTNAALQEHGSHFIVFKHAMTAV